jgi:hypothetical protein
MKEFKILSMTLIAAIMMLSFSECKKDGSGQSSAFFGNHEVYMVGFANGSGSVALWKNGVLQELPDGTDANSVYVSANDVYVAGTTGGYHDDRRAVLWKNGVMQKLSEKWSDASSVCVFNNIPIVAGTGVYNRSTQRYTGATLWVNGEAQNIHYGNKDYSSSSANSVFVANNNIYTVGNVAGYSCDRAALWINGETTFLTDGTHIAWANSIFVSDNDIYIIGVEKIEPGKDALLGPAIHILWKNGIRQDMPEEVSLSSIYVSNNDVYITGRYGNYAVLWKNGIEQRLTDGTRIAEAKSVFVLDNDVYVAINEADEDGFAETTKLWKNGKMKTISTNRSKTVSMFVK